jgi:hypothetical protein
LFTHVEGVLILDFGTYSECAAVWNPSASAAGTGDLSKEQLQAATNQARPHHHGFSSAMDVERRATSVIDDKRHDAWAAAFRTPPLAQWNLRDLAAARLEFSSSPETAVALGRRGLKQALLAENPDPVAFAKLAQAYEALYEKAVGALSRLYGNDHEDNRYEPENVRLICPARLPSKQRDMLVAALRENPKLRNFDLGVDEATAVAMFDLCALLGSRPELGVGLLQSRYSPPRQERMLDPAARPVTYRVLVVDVGAGTTEVALVEMNIEDMTPAQTVNALGRHWQIAPSILAFGGTADLGADQLTLHFFRVLKGRLTVMNDLPKTEFQHDLTAFPEFLRLWNAAEEAKERLLLAAPSAGAYQVSVDDGEGSGRLRKVSVSFESDLRPEAKSFARRVAVLAVGIAKAGLEAAVRRRAGNEAAGRSGAAAAIQVDRVILSGQTFQSKYIRDEVEAAVKGLLRGESSKAQFEVACFHDNLKSAAMLGAAFCFQSSDGQSPAESRQVIEDLRAGRSRFTVRTSALRRYLTAEFQDRGQRRPVFRRGQPLTGEPTRHSNGLYWARSAPFEVWANIAVDRVDAESLQLWYGGEQLVSDLRATWGNFLFPGFQGAQEDEELRVPARNVFMTFEIDELEQLRLYVHHGMALPLDLSSGMLIQPAREAVALAGVILAESGVAAADVFFHQDRLMAAGAQLPQVVDIAVSQERAYLEISGKGGNCTLLLPFKGHRFLSLDTGGQLRIHMKTPPVRLVAHDGTEQSTLNFLRQPVNSDRWAIELIMITEKQGGQRVVNPFSGAH